MLVSEQIMQGIDKLCEKFGIIIDWSSKNVIPYLETLCKRLITYEIVSSIIWVVIMALISIASIIATKKYTPIFIEGVRENKSTYDVGWEVASVFAIIALVIIYTTSFFVIVEQIIDITECLTFPEMYIFKYVRVLIQGTQ